MSKEEGAIISVIDDMWLEEELADARLREDRLIRKRIKNAKEYMGMGHLSDNEIKAKLGLVLGE